MDFVTVLGVIPELGPIGLVLLILVYVGKQWLSSDSRYKAEIDRLIDAHNTELTRINGSHDEEIAELRQDIIALRREISELRQELSTERAARMEAQEETHRIRLQSGNDVS